MRIFDPHGRTIKIDQHPLVRIKVETVSIFNTVQNRPVLESVQDFLIKVDIKPLMHLLEIITFSLNNLQTCQNYEQNRKKLGKFLLHKVL